MGEETSKTKSVKCVNCGAELIVGLFASKTQRCEACGGNPKKQSTPPPAYSYSLAEYTAEQLVELLEGTMVRGNSIYVDTEQYRVIFSGMSDGYRWMVVSCKGKRESDIMTVTAFLNDRRYNSDPLIGSLKEKLKTIAKKLDRPEEQVHMGTEEAG